MDFTGITCDTGGGTIFAVAPNEEKVSVMPAPEAAAAAEELPEDAGSISRDSWTTRPLLSNQTRAGIGDPPVRFVKIPSIALFRLPPGPGTATSDDVSFATSRETLYFVAGTPPTLLGPIFLALFVTAFKRSTSRVESNATDQLTNGPQACKNEGSLATLKVNHVLPAGNAAPPGVAEGT